MTAGRRRRVRRRSLARRGGEVSAKTKNDRKSNPLTVTFIVAYR